MSQNDELTVLPPPRGYRPEIKTEWRRMVKLMTDQGIDPNSRIDLLEHYIGVVAEDADLNAYWPDALLHQKIELSRRFSTLLAAKLRLRKLLLAPEFKSQPKTLTNRVK